MADIIDVETAIVNSIAGLLFSPGYLNGAATVSLLGPTIRLYPGWANNNLLDKDLSLGYVNVSVFTENRPARLTTRYEQVWVQQTSSTPTLTATVNGQVVTISGTPSTAQVAAIRLGPNAAVSYRCLSNSTPSTIAAALAAQLAYASPMVSGPAITFPLTVDNVQAATGVDQSGWLETRRQSQGFRITIWAPNPTLRQQIGSAVDAMMSNVRRFSLPDGTSTDVPLSRGTRIFDNAERANLFRRDLMYSVEYATTITQAQTPMLFADIDVNGDLDTPIISNPVVPSAAYNFLSQDAVNELELEDGNIFAQENYPYNLPI